MVGCGGRPFFALKRPGTEQLKFRDSPEGAPGQGQEGGGCGAYPKFDILCLCRRATKRGRSYIEEEEGIDKLLVTSQGCWDSEEGHTVA